MKTKNPVQLEKIVPYFFQHQGLKFFNRSKERKSNQSIKTLIVGLVAKIFTDVLKDPTQSTKYCWNFSSTWGEVLPPWKSFIQKNYGFICLLNGATMEQMILAETQLTSKRQQQNLNPISRPSRSFSFSSFPLFFRSQVISPPSPPRSVSLTEAAGKPLTEATHLWRPIMGLPWLDWWRHVYFSIIQIQKQALYTFATTILLNQ